MNLMEVDTDVKDHAVSQPNPSKGVNKSKLHERLKPRHLQMDYEEDSWTRSVNTNNNTIKITVHF